MQAIGVREGRAKGLARDASGISVGWYLAGFAGVFLLLFLASNRNVVLYDEGILLTNAMRMMAGQVPHRDFYYNYGPAMPYVLAGLFKVVGPSVLVERLFLLFGDSLLVMTLYAITRRVCGLKVSAIVALYALLWVFGIGSWTLLGTLILWATWLLSSVFQEDVSGRRAFAAGLLVGLATLIRYDVGAGTIGCHVVTAAIACGLRQSSVRSWAASMARSLWAYVLGVVAIVGLPAMAYLQVAPLHDLLFDIVLYTARYYRVARGLPWPWRHLAQLQDLVVYVLVVVMAVGLYVAARYLLAWRRRSGPGRGAIPQWIGLLVSFCLLALMAFVKGMVRIGAGPEALSGMFCILITAVLYEHRESFGVGLRRILLAMIAMFWITAGWAALHPISSEHKFRSSMLLWMVEPGKMNPQPPFESWCRYKSPMTRGVCYTFDSDHIQTVEFLDDHTRPGDTLYVGLPQHDRILENDNMTYFAAQRLPATKWSHFDPFLQNSVETQREMIADLERNRPPYVVLDSEFDTQQEPNGSSVHTGVHLLDDYIQQHYRWVKTFGEMTILERMAG